MAGDWRHKLSTPILKPKFNQINKVIFFFSIIVKEAILDKDHVLALTDLQMLGIRSHQWLICRSQHCIKKAMSPCHTTLKYHSLNAGSLSVAH